MQRHTRPYLLYLEIYSMGPILKANIGQHLGYDGIPARLCCFDPFGDVILRIEGLRHLPARSGGTSPLTAPESTLPRHGV